MAKAYHMRKKPSIGKLPLEGGLRVSIEGYESGKVAIAVANDV